MKRDCQGTALGANTVSNTHHVCGAPLFARLLDLADCRGISAALLCATLPALPALQELHLDGNPEVCKNLLLHRHHAERWAPHSGSAPALLEEAGRAAVEVRSRLTAA